MSIVRSAEDKLTTGNCLTPEMLSEGRFITDTCDRTAKAYQTVIG